MKLAILRLTLFVLFFYSTSYSQDRDSVIQLSSSIGDAMDYAEMKKFNFNFFERLNEFQHAVFYLRNDTLLVAKAIYLDTWNKADSTIIFKSGSYGKYRASIRQTELEEVKKIMDSRRVNVFSKKELFSEVVIESADEELLTLIIPEIKYDENKFPIINRTRIYKNDIKKVIVLGNSNILSGLGYGFAAGFAIGALAGSSSNNLEGVFVITGAIIGAGGALVGLIIGAATTDYEEDILITDDYDLRELEKYSFGK